MRFIVTIIFSCLIPISAIAQVHLSEILYNEPESRTRLEWIEVYNSEEISISLSNYKLIINDDTIPFPAGISIPETSYALISRQLLPNDGSDSFEGHWGDSSGYWGDYTSEQYLALDLDFALTNSNGFIGLLDINNGQIDSFTWHSEGLDGHSFERDNNQLLLRLWHQCQTSDGSTPGLANSVLSNDDDESLAISVDPRLISLSSNEQFVINFSLAPGLSLTIEIFDDSGIKRKILATNNRAESPELTWDGTDLAGNKLGPGIYLMLFSLDGIYKKTKTVPVVIAP